MRWIGQITYDEVAYFREDVIIEAGNKLGIGTTSPASALHVAGTVQVGVDDTGHDVIFYGATSGKKMQWDESADTLIVDGSLDINGSSNISGEAFFTNSIDVTSSGHSTRFRDGHKVHFNTARTASIYTSSDDLYIENGVDDKDIIFRCDDGSGGVTTYFQLDGGEGRTVFKQNALWEDSKAIYMGNGADLRLYHNGSNSFIESHTGNLTIDSAANDADIIFKGTDGSADITALTLDMSDAGTAIFNHDIKIADDGILKIGNSTDLYLSHDATNSHIVNATGDLKITQNANDKDIIFNCDDGSGGNTAYFFLDGSQATAGGTLFTKWGDNSYISLGDGSDLYFFHNGTDSKMQNSTGDLLFENYADDKDIIFKSDDGSGGVTAYLTLDGSEARMNAHKDLRFDDDEQLQLGAGADMQIYHNGGTSIITNQTGNILIRNQTDDGDIVFQADDGSGGDAEYFRLDGGAGIMVASKEMRFADNAKLKLGSGPDLEIYHDGSNSYITQSGTGDLIIEQKTADKDIILKSDDGSGGETAYLTLDGSAGTIEVAKPMNLAGNLVVSGAIISAAGTNANLEMNAGSDIVLEADNAGGGNASSIQYLDAGGTNRIMLGASSDVVQVCNRAANGTVVIKANTSTAGGGGETLAATFTDTETTLAGNLVVSGDRIDFSNVPTSDPEIAGIVWNSSGDLKISAGS